MLCLLLPGSLVKGGKSARAVEPCVNTECVPKRYTFQQFSRSFWLLTSVCGMLKQIMVKQHVGTWVMGITFSHRPAHVCISGCLRIVNPGATAELLALIFS